MAYGNIGKLFVEIGADISGLKKGLSGAETQVSTFGKNVKKSGKAIGDSMTSAGKGMTAGITAPLVAAGAGFMILSGKAANFENQMNEVFTLMPGMSKEAMDAMTEDVLKFSKEMGTLPNESVPALYQAISAGVPPDNVFDFMRTANKAAIGGVTNLETAVDGITSVVNAYGSDIVSATEASDLMFTAVKLGKTNFDELSGSLFQVIPTASALGVEFGDVTAALATMTAQGTPTRIASTQLRQVFVELSKSTSKTSKAFQEVSGVTFQEFIAQGGNVQDALGIMEQAAATNGVALQDMFGSVEAGNAALALTGKGAESFRNNLAEMNNSLGATDTAFATMDKSASRSMAKLKAEFSAVMIELGNEFIPILKDDLLPIFRDDIAPLLTDVVVPAIKLAAGAFSAMSPGMKKVALVVLALAAALGPVLMVLGPIISGITALAPIISAVVPAVTAAGAAIGAVALGPIALIIAAIVAVIGIVFLARKAWSENWGGIQEKTAAVWDWLKGFFSGLVDGLATAITSSIHWISTLGDKLLFLLGPVGMIIYAFRNWEQIKTIVSNILGGLVNYINGLISTFGSAGRNIMNAFVSGVTAGINRAVAKVREGLAKIRNLMPGSDAKEGPLSDITASGKALMTTFEKGISGSDARPAAAFTAKAPDVAGMAGAGAGAGISNSSSSITIGEVHLSKDYDFEALMQDINRYQQSKRIQRGIGSI
ncbi:MAG: phage tail tape measure protein [ANME-2 cluster archaeon]|nr:phage tail tape measure protein [ANME-2 cluster archaeon]